MFLNAPAAAAEHAERVRFVHHQKGAVAPLDLDEVRQVGNVAVHAVQAFDDDQHALVLQAALRQQLIQRLPIVVRERHAPRARQLAADERAVVDQRVVHDQILRPEQVADGRDIGGMAAHEHDAIVDAVHGGQRLLEFAVDGALAGDQAARRRRRAVAVDRRLRGRVDVRVPGQAQVVVAREIGEGFPADHRGRAGEIPRACRKNGLLTPSFSAPSLRMRSCW